MSKIQMFKGYQGDPPFPKPAELVQPNIVDRARWSTGKVSWLRWCRRTHRPPGQFQSS